MIGRVDDKYKDNLNYHKPTDTPEKINHPLLAKRTKLDIPTA